MPKIVQEKYQLNYPPARDDNGNGWVTDKSARVKKNTPGREGHPGGDSDSRFMNNGVMTQSLPPGMDIEDQEFTDQRKFGISYNGNNPVAPAKGDVTNNETSPTQLRKGFSVKPLLQTDDEYTREHNDAFYDDVGGFIERNNYMDRS